MTEENEMVDMEPGATDISTDGGRLPRPFMGRGSIRRRHYRMPSASSISLSINDEQQGLLANDGELGIHANLSLESAFSMPTNLSTGIVRWKMFLTLYSLCTESCECFFFCTRRYPNWIINNKWKV